MKSAGYYYCLISKIGHGKHPRLLSLIALSHPSSLPLQLSRAPTTVEKGQYHGERTFKIRVKHLDYNSQTVRREIITSDFVLGVRTVLVVTSNRYIDRSNGWHMLLSRWSINFDRFVCSYNVTYVTRVTSAMSGFVTLQLFWFCFNVSHSNMIVSTYRTHFHDRWLPAPHHRIVHQS
jgi:hypothetical protein